MQIQYRQGDVFLTRVADHEITRMRRLRRSAGRLVLARGEATGHAHAVASDQAELYGGPEGRRFLRLVEPARLEHEEHAPINLPAGLYEVKRQREYSPGGMGLVSD